MNSRARSGAFTLIEVLIALVVLGVGVMAAVQLQATSLRASSQAEGIQDATLVADAELDFRLQMSLSPVTSANCLSSIPEGYQCSVTVTPCSVVDGEVSCDSSVAPADRLGYSIQVDATTPRGQQATLETFAASRQESSSDEDEGSGDEEEEGGDDEGEEGEEGGEEGEGDEEDGGGDGEEEEDGGTGDDGGGGGRGAGGGPPSCVPPSGPNSPC